MSQHANGYRPEMNEKRPADTQIDAQLCHYGEHYYLWTPLTLKGRGVRLIRVLTAAELTPKAAHKAGWNYYCVTIAAFDKIAAQYRVALEMNM